MPFDGAGNYGLPAGSEAVDGTDIEAATHNTPIEDIAAALNQVLLRSGLAPMTGDLQMGSNTIVGLAPGSVEGEAVSYEQVSSLINGAFAAPITVTYGVSQAALLTLVSTNDDALQGPILSLQRLSPSPAAMDVGPAKLEYGKQADGTTVLYAGERTVFTSVGNGSFSASKEWGVASGGAFAYRVALTGAGIYPLSNNVFALGADTQRFASIFAGHVNCSGYSNFYSTMGISGAFGGIPGLYINRTDGAPLSNAYMIQFTDQFSNLNGSITMNQGAGPGIGAGTQYNTSSDRRLKRNIETLDFAAVLATLSAVRPVSYDRGPGSEREAGFLAQELYEVVPEVVRPGVGEPGEDGFEPWQMQYGRMEPLVIAAIKGLLARIDELEERLTALGG